jgi:hypothetical protein
MRLWSLHPKYLDAKGLVALWREGLLARAVLLGQTSGYRHHPQLLRFQQQPNPMDAIDFYLEQVAVEAENRGYHFNRAKITPGKNPARITICSGQVEYEFAHLKGKLRLRDPKKQSLLETIKFPEVHPLFQVIPGGTESWEKVGVIQPKRTQRMDNEP